MISKLRREWKTFAWGVISIALELWDTILAYQLSYVEPIIPENKQWILHVAIPLGFFFLRKWKDEHVASDAC